MRASSPKPKKNASAERLVGAQVALFRRAARLTQRELAQRLGVHEETIASIEQGRRPLKLDHAEVLDELLETKGALVVAVENLPERAKFPVWAAEFIDYERKAIALSSYQNQVVPGLLQTESYARAVFRNEIPLLSEVDLEQRVAARIERQAILRRKIPPSASFIISEAVLTDRLGGDEVYVEQLRHLRECADLPGLSLQVMPLGRMTHAGLSGPFILLETPDHNLLAYAETQRGSLLISDPDEVSILARKYAMLRTQALNPEENKGLLDRLLGEQ
ncbi:helix-turn-helix domain-containing protein [Streptantibioticus ferralitis]|uniref:Helix-turn-helix transcriptional regulator n=1 Tax=Streptantibioticus ferralitis TaxID=236510 RepID=A0ABT5Z9R3_9ACTN|nr:helix-turn-helix transcriptional regulator [Streptantibioticus ferralitis]MDF2259800.1 helix-turn-helix transcriptional regulator [Streptantibioticus ferralitis]